MDRTIDQMLAVANERSTTGAGAAVEVDIASTANQRTRSLDQEPLAIGDVITPKGRKILKRAIPGSRYFSHSMNCQCRTGVYDEAQGKVTVPAGEQGSVKEWYPTSLTKARLAFEEDQEGNQIPQGRVKASGSASELYASKPNMAASIQAILDSGKSIYVKDLRTIKTREFGGKELVDTTIGTFVLVDVVEA